MKPVRNRCSHGSAKGEVFDLVACEAIVEWPESSPHGTFARHEFDAGTADGGIPTFADEFNGTVGVLVVP